MIKFINKKHIHTEKDPYKIVIYYSVSDIFLGTILMALVIFFIHDYLSHSLPKRQDFSHLYLPAYSGEIPTKNSLKEL